MHQAKAVNTTYLWHKSLGHLSSEVFSFLRGSLGINSSRDEHDVCEIYFRANQTCGRFFV